MIKIFLRFKKNLIIDNFMFSLATLNFFHLLEGDIKEPKTLFEMKRKSRPQCNCHGLCDLCPFSMWVGEAQ